MLNGKKRVVAILIVMIAYVIILSGCQSVPALCNDVAGSAQWLGDKLQPYADAAEARDAELQAKWLMKYNAEQKAQAEVNAKVGL